MHQASEGMGGRRARARSRPYRDGVRYTDARGRFRIGVVVPFDFGVDWQYWRYVPQDVTLHFTRTPYTPLTVGLDLAHAVSEPAAVEGAVRALGGIEPDVVAYACSSGSFVDGLAGERSLRQTMCQAGAAHAVTTSGAAVEALRACGTRRVAVASPYTPELTDELAGFLEEAGFEVVSAVHLGLQSRIADVAPGTIRDLVRQAHSPDADAVFLACTGLRTLGIVAQIEAEIGRPLFTANQVTLWSALRIVGALRPAGKEPVLGDRDPMAWSTTMLVDAARGGAQAGPRAAAG